MDYVVLDLEMCNVPKGMRSYFRRANEIIQIGAVRVNSSYEIVDKFDMYVKPEFGKLDTTISALTGIRYDDLKGAKGIKEVMKEFINWIGNDEVMMVSWSDTDYHQIKRECELKNIVSDDLDRILSNWNDCQKTFCERLDKSRLVSLEEALISTGIQTEGSAHNGYYDAYNTALLFVKMEKEQIITFDPVYEKAKNGEIEHLSFSLGDLFGSLCLSAV